MLHSSPFLLPKSAEMKNFVGIEIGKLLAREFRLRVGSIAVLRTDYIIIKASVLMILDLKLILVIYRISLIFINKKSFLFNPEALNIL